MCNVIFQQPSKKVKRIVYCGVIITLGFILLSKILVFAISAVDPNVDYLIINYEEMHGTHQYAPVPFTHKMHYVDYEIPCRKCHHEWKLEVRDNPVKCMECHKGKETNGVIILKSAFHRCCIHCHRDLRMQKKRTGPERCKKCHILSDTSPRRTQ